NHGRRMGITTWIDSSRFGLALTLGGGEVKMIDMATAFGAFANQGYKVPLSPVIHLEGSNGQTIYELSPKREKVISEGTAYIISDILSDNFARQWAFGSRSALEIPGYRVAVKTGTTDQMKDNWTVGFTPDFLVAVWVGNNDNTPMNRYLVSGITGAAPIWNRVMTYLLKRYESGNSWFPKPESVFEKPCYFGRSEYFLIGTEKNAVCNIPLKKPSPTKKPD
ncbi:hypothetical protein HYW87_01325, partial [Candidatus Roizmanbacteria bacterium]|nr:hypothetical protein [Candidatus Roizmanbacteria bacterium]